MSKHSSKGTAWNKVRKLVLEMYNYECVICGSTEKPSVDHIIPKSKGGTDDLENLQVLCTSHNSKKNDKFGPEDKSEWNKKYFPAGGVRRPGRV